MEQKKYLPEKRKSKGQSIIGYSLLIVLCSAMIVSFISRPFSIEVDLNHRLEAISSTHPLGTDDVGRDVLSCLIYGAMISVLTGLCVVMVSSLFGGIVGLISGYAGGWVDVFFMRIVDVLLAFPGILLAITLAAFFSHGPVALMVILSVVGWAEYARLVRGEILKYKQKEFILAARSYNASFFRILFHHLLPCVRSLIVLQAGVNISGVIIAESSLAFLGIGINPKIPTLGQAINAGRDHLFDNPVLILAPGIVLFIIVMAFVFIGDGFTMKMLRKNVSEEDASLWKWKL